MLGLSANLNYYLFNGNVDLRKGIFRLCESIREEMSLDPSDASNVYMFMSRNRKVRLTGESTYGLSLQSMSSWFIIITTTAAEHLMWQRPSLSILWDLYPPTDIRFTGCMTEKTQRCFI